ncbi:hypothetical protein K502DRAFT_333121 [Neoconidiobolus thromboides FSU 785]|nr:hypothetical protein K502DRAFT_333121 [Neoconidiobolus thromboides FSU 785]
MNGMVKMVLKRYFILQDENRDKLFYVSGYCFNIETKEIKPIFEPPHNMIIHQLFILNNKLYYFLDLGLEDRKKSGQNKLYELDLKSKDVKEYDIKIKHNDHFEPIKYNQSIYFIGYEKGEDANFLGDVYELKLGPFSFKKIKQIRISNNECFSVYKDYLINSFGLYFISKERKKSVESSNKILLTNMSNWG